MTISVRGVIFGSRLPRYGVNFARRFTVNWGKPVQCWLRLIAGHASSAPIRGVKNCFVGRHGQSGGRVVCLDQHFNEVLGRFPRAGGMTGWRMIDARNA